jgi:hypothetical protein
VKNTSVTAAENDRDGTGLNFGRPIPVLSLMHESELKVLFAFSLI